MPAKKSKSKPRPAANKRASGGRSASPCSPSSGIEAAVCEDIAKRQRLGIQKYGVTVADNPLDLHEWLQHAYEECLDQAIYLKRAMMEAAALKMAGREIIEAARRSMPRKHGTIERNAKLFFPENS